MTKYNYITQAQLNTALGEFLKKLRAETFDEFFTNVWVPVNVPELRAPLTRLTPVQRAFVANVLTIFNNI